LSRRAESLLPIAFTYAVVGFTAVDWWLSGRLDWFGLGAGATLSLLLVARQGVVAGQMEMRQFAAMVNASADLSFTCRADGVVRLANPALRRAVGLSAPADRALRLDDFLAGDEAAEDILLQGLENGWSGEVRFRSPDGSTFPVWLSLRPVYDERRAQPMLAATGHDLTSIKRREHELRSALEEVANARRQLEALNAVLEHKVEARTKELEDTVADLARLNQELQELDRLKTEFVALVSHELRAPLTNIRSGVELILEGEPTLPERASDSLRLVQEETRRLARFVETILDLSALEAGRFPLNLAPVPLKDVARVVCRRFPKSAGGGRLKLDFPEDLPPVLADERALSSVFFHLLDNALKYAPEGSVQVEARSDRPQVFVAVSDCGPGIPPEERERVFEMFHRLDNSDAREVYGHGLGLHLARRLLGAMGGGIRAEEAPEGGARLVFWLPQAG
jgi:PAS domain S-box-containing protein